VRRGKIGLRKCRYAAVLFFVFSLSCWLVHVSGGLRWSHDLGIFGNLTVRCRVLLSDLRLRFSSRPARTAALRDLGKSYVLLQAHDMATTYYFQVVVLDPADWRIWAHLILCHYIGNAECVYRGT